jgi:ABC-type nickel/cobalt efflux system permease component RcnA
LIGLAAFVVLALGAIQDGLRASGALEIAGNIIILLAPMALLIRELRLRKQTSHPDETAATASYWRGLVRVYEQRKRAERRWSIGFFCALSAGFALTLTSAALPALQARQVQSGVIAECLIDVVALVGVSLFVRKRRRHLQEALQLLADGESVPCGN